MFVLPPRMVVATHNAGKLREIRELFDPFGIECLSADVLGLAEPDEIGTTFKGNAAIKAEAASFASGLPALADDSGLCVEALDGQPGIYSARWAKEQGSFALAMDQLKLRLDDLGEQASDRAWFISVLAFASPGEETRFAEGRVDGSLVFPPRGTLGFGYDPVFRPDGHDRTFGEMSPAEKHGIPADGSTALSHRARAFQAFTRMIERQP